jgi:hypothetical protein
MDPTPEQTLQKQSEVKKRNSDCSIKYYITMNTLKQKFYPLFKNLNLLVNMADINRMFNVIGEHNAASSFQVV